MPIPDTLGWYEIPNTHLQTVAANANSLNGSFAYSGGIYDSRRHRLVCFGGGHTDSFDNGIYALDLPTLTPVRIADPSTNHPGGSSAESYPDGKPSSRHTYDQMCYVPHLDSLFEFSGSYYELGGGGQQMWLYNFTTGVWFNAQPSGTKPLAAQGGQAKYDPYTGKVFLHEDNANGRLWVWDPFTNAPNGTWTLLTTNSTSGYDSHTCAVFDPVRRRLHHFGAGVSHVTDVSGNGANYNRTNFPTTGPQAIVTTGFPGLAYDPVLDRIVGWIGNSTLDTVYLLNPDTGVWTSQTYSNGPNAASFTFNGTFGHWQYSPLTGTFICVNSPQNNFWSLRLSTATAPANRATIYNRTASTQTNRVVTMGRPFRQGDIAQYAQAVINGTAVLTQCDVKNRWSDGSLKFAVVSFIIPSLAASGSVCVGFQNQSSGNNTGYLDEAGMLAAGYDFNGRISMVGAATRNIDARTILDDANFRYVLQGPICTSVVLEDKTATRAYDVDFGDSSKALHPIFEARFYPQGNKVELGYCVENCWASSSVASRNLSYSLTLTSGNGAPTTEYTNASFSHIWRSKWRKKFWLGTDPGLIKIDHYVDYLCSTKFLPNMDPKVPAAESAIALMYSDWTASNKTIQGTSTAIGNYLKDLEGAGAAYWIGLLATWDAIWLRSGFDVRMEEACFGNYDLSGRIPTNFREADTQAGSGLWFDKPTQQGGGSVDTRGRVVSVNARRTVSLYELDAQVCAGSSGAADQISNGLGASTDGWATEYAHKPAPAYLPYLLTGYNYYLEDIQFQGAYAIAWKVGCYDLVNTYNRQGDAGYFHQGQVRGDGWAARDCAYAAFVSPDSTPEQTYFDDKLKNNIANWEGKMNLTNSYSAKLSHWTFGNTYRKDADGISPLGIWDERNSGFVQDPLRLDGYLETGCSGFEEHFLIVAFGMCKQFGYQMDSLLRYMAKLRFHIMLDPTSLKYLIESYRWPGKKAATSNWIQTWTDFKASYASLPSAYFNANGSFAYTDHGYAFPALAALSYLTDYTVDGYTGPEAFTKYYNEILGRSGLSTASPKWAIVPLSIVTSSGTTPTPPAAPTGLRRTN